MNKTLIYYLQKLQKSNSSGKGGKKAAGEDLRTKEESAFMKEVNYRKSKMTD